MVINFKIIINTPFHLTQQKTRMSPEQMDINHEEKQLFVHTLN